MRHGSRLLGIVIASTAVLAVWATTASSRADLAGTIRLQPRSPASAVVPVARAELRTISLRRVSHDVAATFTLSSRLASDCRFARLESLPDDCLRQAARTMRPSRAPPSEPL